MKIWQLDIEVDKYKCLKLVDNSEWNLFDNLDGRKLLNSWHPIKVEFTKSKKNKKVPDAFYLSPSAPVFNLNAIEVLKEFIQRDIEYFTRRRTLIRFLKPIVHTNKTTF